MTIEIILGVMFCLFIIYTYIYIKQNKSSKNNPYVGQLWIRNYRDPFEKKKIAKILDIRKNTNEETYVKVHYYFGDNMEEDGYDDSWDFDLFKIRYIPWKPTIDMSFKEFRNDIIKAMKTRPSWSRKGQFVFNYIEEKYGEVARTVQFNDKIDCFYRDEMIEPFIQHCYTTLTTINKYNKK